MLRKTQEITVPRRTRASLWLRMLAVPVSRACFGLACMIPGGWDYPGFDLAKVFGFRDEALCLGGRRCAGKKTKLQALGFGHDVDADPNSTHKFITTGASQAAEPSKGPAKQRGSLRSFNAPLI